MEQVVKHRPATQSKIALHLMINQLSLSSLPAAIKNENTLVNHVPAELLVNTDTQKLAAVVGSLLNTVVSHTRNTALVISVKSYSDVMILHIKGNTRFNHPEFTRSMTKIQHLADCIGGTVGVTSFRNNISTVALSFINNKIAC